MKITPSPPGGDACLEFDLTKLEAEMRVHLGLAKPRLIVVEQMNPPTRHSKWKTK